MLRRVAPTAIVGGASVLLLTAYLSADTRTVEKPMFNGNRLGWCASWGADCGEPAAEAWCIAQGFAGAKSFVKASAIGDKSPTRLIATGAVCDSADCDGFKSVTCRKLDTVDPGAGETAAPEPPALPAADAPAMKDAEGPASDTVATVAAAVPDPETVPTPVAAPDPDTTTDPAASDIPEPPPAPDVPVEAAAEVDAGTVTPVSATAEPATTGATSVHPEVAVADVAAEDDPGPPPPDTITLAAAGAPPLRPVFEVFKSPTFDGRRLDWCRGWKDACGKATADEFCRLNGFVEALSFVPDPAIGAAEPTRQIASGLVCDNEGCDGFAEIACRK